LAEVEQKGFEIPADAVRIGENSFHVVPAHAMLPGETVQEASTRLLTETFSALGWIKPEASIVEDSMTLGPFENGAVVLKNDGSVDYVIPAGWKVEHIYMKSDQETA